MRQDDTNNLINDLIMNAVNNYDFGDNDDNNDTDDDYQIDDSDELDEDVLTESEDDSEEDVVSDADDVNEDETVSEETEESDEDNKEKKKGKKRINTSGVFDNTGFYNGGNGPEAFNSTGNIAISPVVEDQYDYSVAEDIVLLNDRKDTSKIIYDIYMHSPFADDYRDKKTGLIKIPKDEIQKVFYYIKDKLLKRKRVSAFECVIAINEFFDFNYDYIVKKVVSSKMMSEILEDYYQNMGMKDRIDEQSAEPLF